MLMMIMYWDKEDNKLKLENSLRTRQQKKQREFDAEQPVAVPNAPVDIEKALDLIHKQADLAAQQQKQIELLTKTLTDQQKVIGTLTEEKQEPPVYKIIHVNEGGGSVRETDPGGEEEDLPKLMDIDVDVIDTSNIETIGSSTVGGELIEGENIQSKIAKLKELKKK
jgi:hypothetical protein